MSRSLTALLLCAAAVAVAYPVCPSSGGNDCQMGWSTQHPDGPATGGEGAPKSMTFVVRNRAEFVAAVSKEGKKIIYVSGTIRGDDIGRGQVADMAYFKAKTGYDFDAYLRNPKSMGQQRQAVLKLQGPLIVVDLNDDTSIIGLGNNARIEQMNLRLKRATNVVIRNIEIETPRDFATAWSSNDGWNAEWDSLTVEASTRLWFDHLTFTDGRFPDWKAGQYKGKNIQWHDGMLDLKKGSDFVTISNCIFKDHAKTNLIGSSDKMAAIDSGRLRITFYKNMWSNTESRAPRVRFGKVHLLGNYYQAGENTLYFMGMGYQCSILSEGNVFEARRDKQILDHFKGTQLRDSGSWFNGVPYSSTIQALAGGNGNLGWAPTYKYSVPANVNAAKAEVLANAGAGKLRIAADTGDNATMVIPDGVQSEAIPNAGWEGEAEDPDTDENPTSGAAVACASAAIAALLALAN
eukprot:m51a1_g9142 hypothetical protein (463) ;mRNA; f:79791-81179